MQELLGPAKARNSKSQGKLRVSHRLHRVALVSQARAVLADEKRLKLLMDSVDADPRTVVKVVVH